MAQKKKKKGPAKSSKSAKRRPKAALRARSKKASSRARTAAKRPAAKRRATRRVAKRSTAKKGASTQAIVRRDRVGHIDPKYASDLHRRATEGAVRDDDAAFVGRPRSGDDLAEQLGEEVVTSATSGEHEGEDFLNQDVPEERGGPFIVSPAEKEFAGGTDPSNPKGSTREPFPRT